MVYASHGGATAANAVRVDPTSLWEPGASTPTWYVQLASSMTLYGFGIGNHTFASEVIHIIEATTFGGTTGGAAVSRTFPANNDDVVFVEPLSGPNITIQFQSSVPSGSHWGVCSCLTNAGAIEISDGGIYHDIDMSITPGHAVITAASGAQINQIVGGTRQNLGLQLMYIPTGSGSLGDKIQDSLRDNDGWANGVWVTDNTFGSVTTDQGRGYYCHVVGAIQSQIVDAVGHRVFALNLQEMSKGIQGSF